MTAKNEIVPLDAGPTRQTIAAPAPIPAKSAKGHRNDAANADAMTSQERRIRLVAIQRRHTAFQLFYGLFGIALMVVQMEYLWFANTKDFDGACAVDAATQCPTCLASLAHAVPVTEGRMMLHATRVLISFSTVILLYYVYAFYTAECEVLKIKNIVPPKATLLSSPLRNKLLFELLLFVIHPFPGLETIDPRWPNLVVASSLLMFPRIFLLFRVVEFRNSFNSSNGWFIGALTNVDFTTAFFLKSTLKNHPSRWIFASFVLLLAVTGYSLYVVERFLCAFHGDSCCTPIAFTDSLWSLVTTMLTIGYGDVVPHTSAGRFFEVLAGLFGTVFTAVTIAVMSSYLVLTRSEHKVNAFIKKDENRRLVNEHAARAIQAYVQLRAMQRRVANSKTKTAVARAEHKLYDVLRVYRQVKRFVNSHDVSDPMDKQMTMLEMMEVNVEYIRTKIEDLSDLFQSQVDKHSKRRLQTAAITTSAAMAMANAGAAAVVANAIAQANGHHAVSTASMGDGSFSGSNGSASLTANGGPQSNNVAPNHGAASASTSSPPGSSSGGNGNPTNMPRASGVPGQPPIYDSDNEPTANQQRRELATPELLVPTTRRPTVSSGAPSGSAGQPTSVLSQGSSRSLVVHDVNDAPEWAANLEHTMQAILLQVSRVSNEMDTMRTRVQSQMDHLHARMGDIEKRLGVQDAFREITRAPSSRKVLNRSSSKIDTSDAADGNGSGPTNGPTASDGQSLSGNGSQVTLAAVTRFSRKSFANRRPSIHNFVTVKDLEEFQNSGGND